MTEAGRYWFRAKPHGYGWRLPLCWQGWLVYALALVGLVASFLVFPEGMQLAYFLAMQWGVILLVVAACALKGEPLRRR